MENNKLPAYPHQTWEEIGMEGGVPAVAHGTSEKNGGFTKIELASLMIAQGMCAETVDRGTNFIAQKSVEIAKAVLEEANK